MTLPRRYALVLIMIVSVCAIAQENAVSPEAKALYEEAEKLAAAGKFAEAQPKLVQSAELGYSVAQFELGKLLQGAGKPHDALEYFEAAADQGNVDAMNMLGRLYANGSESTPKNPTIAKDWLQKSAAAGNAEGNTLLGILYETYPMGENMKWAMKHLQDAADMGYAPAQAELGRLYIEGKDVTHDSAKAVDLLNKAAAQNYAQGEFMLGMLYGTGGAGLSVNVWRAQSLVDLAAEHGDANMKIQIALCYMASRGVTYTPDKAIALLTPLADQGHLEAQTLLGEIYCRDEIVLKPNWPKAFELFKNAAEKDHTRAQINLAKMYYHGLGSVKKDAGQAYYWAKIAMASDKMNAYQLVDAAAKELTPKQIAELDNFVQLWLNSTPE